MSVSQSQFQGYVDKQKMLDSLKGKKTKGIVYNNIYGDTIKLIEG